jgi:hypothetical protein
MRGADVARVAWSSLAAAAGSCAGTPAAMIIGGTLVDREVAWHLRTRTKILAS